MESFAFDPCVMEMTATKTKTRLPDDGSAQDIKLDEPGSGAVLQSEMQLCEKCIECGLCQKECRFLTEYGHPGSIAGRYKPAGKADQDRAFECSLCGLCTAVCPVGVDPARMFLQMRRDAVRRSGGDYPEHSTILGYERRGTSRRYTWYALPQGCGTVFFPGCTLPGTRPEKVKVLYEHLRHKVPDLGIVLDCCSKPSHDLGREDFFQAAFGEMKAYLLENGVRNVLVACPNCYRVFKNHGGELSVETVYEALADNNFPFSRKVSGSVTIHDPCSVRFEEPIHKAVRILAQRTGLSVEEMPHHGPKTLCCGEGGSVGFLSPDLAKNWRSLRKEESQGRRIITYCAGCANALGKVAPASHVLDLLFEPEAALAGKVKVSRAPVTYWNRMRLKSWFKKNVDAAVTRERPYSAGRAPGKGSLILRILILALIVGAIAAVRMTGAARFMEQETLRGWIEACGIYGSLIYMLVYAIAPALFLPGLPITIAGGVLFGPFWGVVYTITGATTGACLAFLISRHLARDWIERKMRGPRWRKLDEDVQRHGWKVVAITRLIPLFPFNLLNYAFGLTKIKFLHYAAATFVCMLPACIAFIVFSSSLLNVIQGKISTEFIIGLVLIVLVSTIPVIYRKRR